MIRTNRSNPWPALMGAAFVALVASGPAHASLARNAAGAKNIGDAERLTIDTAAQVESDPDGKLWIFETGIQYQLSKRLQLLVEGALHESLQPDSGANVSGPGDTDVTLSWLVAAGNRSLPSVVFGTRVKLPTANQEEIGTGQVDASALLILGKGYGELDLSLETEFASFGQPGDERLRNQLLYAFTAEYGVNDFLAIYGEVYGNSAPSADGSRTDAARVGLELDFSLSKRATPYLSLDVDTEQGRTARAGVEWTW